MPLKELRIAPAPTRPRSDPPTQQQQPAGLSQVPLPAAGGIPGARVPARALPPRRSPTRKPACIPCKIKKIKCRSGQQPCHQCKSRFSGKAALENCQYEMTAREQELRLEVAQLTERNAQLEHMLASRSSMPAHWTLLPQPPPENEEAPVLEFPPTLVGGDIMVQPFHFGPRQPSPFSGGSSSSSDGFIQPEQLLAISASPGGASDPLPPSQTTGGLDTELMLLPKPHHSQAHELEVRFASVYPPLMPSDAGQLPGLQLIFDPSHVNSEIDAAQIKNACISKGVVTELCDVRLHQLEIGRWTSVLISNDLAARLISHYLTSEHSTMRLFDSDLFLDGLVSGSRSYCSPPLVNALLAWACISYHTDDMPQGLLELSIVLFATAERLFWQARNMNTITSAAAAIMLEVVASISGRPEEGTKYRLAAASISQAIGLFGVPGPLLQETGVDDGIDWNRASAHTAWGIFTHNTYGDLHTRSNTLGEPPLLPLAGRDSHIGRDGIMRLIPSPGCTDASYVDECELALIVHDINKLCSQGPANSSGNVVPNLEKAEHCYRRLLSWAGALPLSSARGSQNSPEAIIMHMHFHSAVLVLFQPFLRGPLQRLRLQTFNTGGSPGSVFNSSVDQLKRLVIIQRSRFEQDRSCIQSMSGALFLASSLCQLGFLFQGKKVPEERRHYFAICIAALFSQLRQVPALSVTIRGLISLGLSSGTITAEYAKSATSGLTESDGEGARNPIYGQPFAADRIISCGYVSHFELTLEDAELTPTRTVTGASTGEREMLANIEPAFDLQEANS